VLEGRTQPGSLLDFTPWGLGLDSFGALASITPDEADDWSTLTNLVRSVDSLASTNAFFADSFPSDEPEPARIPRSGESSVHENFVTIVYTEVPDRLMASVPDDLHKDEVNPGPGPVGGTQIAGPGSWPIPSGSIIFITNNTASGDSWWLWWVKPSGVPQIEGVGNWQDVVNGMQNAPAGGYSALVLSGHGNNGGVSTQGGALNSGSLTAAEAAAIAGGLAPGAPIIILGCEQADHGAEMQALATATGHPVIGNTGLINSGNNGTGNWFQWNPKP
jgi:hypothetical protein